MHVLPILRRRPPAGLLLIVLLFAALVAVPGRADPIDLGKEAYLLPPKELVEAVLGAREQNFGLTNISPDGKKFVVPRSDGLPSLERMGRPCVYLGEAAFDPVACRARDLWIRSAPGFDLFFHADRRTVPVQVPDRARVGSPAWSPDGSKLAFFAHFEDATHIYLADGDTGFSRRLTTTPVLATLDTTFQWSRDGKQIQTVLLPDDGKREAPPHSVVATEPRVRVARGGSHPSRTYRFLLESPHDMKLLEHLATGQLALIDVNDGKVTKVGFPNLIRSVSMAPGEREFRITTMKKPFSYYVPLTNFGTLEGIWNRDGKSVCTLNDRNLRDTDPQTPPPTLVAGAGGRNPGGQAPAPGTRPPTDPQPPGDPDPDPADPGRAAGRTGRGGQPADPDARREIGWRPDGAGLTCLQLEPAKKEDKEPRKDRVLQLLPPYGKDDVKVLYETARRILSHQFSEDGKLLFLTQMVDNQRQISAIDLGDPNKPIYVIHKGGGGGPGAAPAKPAVAGPAEQQPGRGGRGGRGGFGGGGGPTLMVQAHRGEANVVRLSRTGDVYLSGTDRTRGPEAELPRPYIDKVNVKNGKITRIFEGKGEALETVDAVDGDDVKLVFTTRQKKDVVPDSYVTELATGKVTKLTNNVDAAPWYHQLQVQRFQVTRVDGFKFWVKVTTPAKPAGKPPALFWIYPREYADQAAYNASAGRGQFNTGRFETPGPRSMSLLTLLGYAVVEPDVPIVGPPGRMNDNYVPDLRNSLWAAIDELDKRAIIDRDRLAVGGHSYGAFSTANALAHTPFFKAGIAGDGNYNRTLTTMTFQTERRQLWDARETYLEMSPLLWANRVNGALLMYHGMDDANVGTNPINAEHMFMALDGLGKPAALYMYPYEGHGPLAKETTLDLWARWIGWLDKYVKNPPKPSG
jgi:dipeptidyl aminopeptidase/acylaminoacyl peptidase